jgi:hypothetical protein
MESRHHARAMVTQDATPYHGIDAVDHGMGQAAGIEARSKGLRRASKTVSDQSLDRQESSGVHPALGASPRTGDVTSAGRARRCPSPPPPKPYPRHRSGGERCPATRPRRPRAALARLPSTPKGALELHRSGAARGIPILTHRVLLDDASFAPIKALPSNGVPVKSWPDADNAWSNVVQAILQVAYDIRRTSERSTS